MRTIAVLALALFVACGSSTGVIDQRVLDCDEGNIGIRAGLQGDVAAFDGMRDRLMMLVEVSNNSHADIVVKHVRVEQIKDQNTAYELEPGYGNYDQTIPDGEDHTFEVPINGLRALPRSSRPGMFSNEIDLVVTMRLANGDTYRCRFLIPGPA